MFKAYLLLIFSGIFYQSTVFADVVCPRDITCENSDVSQCSVYSQSKWIVINFGSRVKEKNSLSIFKSEKDSNTNTNYLTCTYKADNSIISNLFLMQCTDHDALCQHLLSGNSALKYYNVRSVRPQ